MAHLITIFWYEFRRGVRRKGYLFATIGLPLLLVVIGAIIIAATGLNDPEQAIARNSEQISAVADSFMPNANTRYGILDESGLLGDISLPETMIPYADEAEAQAALADGTIAGYYTIPEDYLETGDILLTMAQLHVGDISTRPAAAVLSRALSERAAQVGLDEATVMRLQDPSNYQITNLSLRTPTAVSESESDDFGGANFILIYVFALVLLLSLFITNGYLLQSVIEEKETKLIEILIASVRPFQLIAGKIAAYGVLGLLQITVWIGFLLIALRVSSGGGLQQAVAILPRWRKSTYQ